MVTSQLCLWMNLPSTVHCTLYSEELSSRKVSQAALANWRWEFQIDLFKSIHDTAPATNQQEDLRGATTNSSIYWQTINIVANAVNVAAF